MWSHEGKLVNPMIDVAWDTTKSLFHVQSAMVGLADKPIKELRGLRVFQEELKGLVAVLI